MSVHLQREIDRVKEKHSQPLRHRRRSGAIVGSGFLGTRRRVGPKRRGYATRHRPPRGGNRRGCLKILALHQPVAIDLRFIIAAMKINNDLERIGDLAVTSPERPSRFAAEPPMADRIRHRRHVAKKRKRCWRDSLDAPGEHERRVWRPRFCRRDDEVDEIKRKIRHRRGGADSRRAGKSAAAHAIDRGFTQSRTHRRLRDDIAEDVIYMSEGRINPP